MNCREFERTLAASVSRRRFLPDAAWDHARVCPACARKAAESGELDELIAIWRASHRTRPAATKTPRPSAPEASVPVASAQTRSPKNDQSPAAANRNFVDAVLDRAGFPTEETAPPLPRTKRPTPSHEFVTRIAAPAASPLHRKSRSVPQNLHRHVRELAAQPFVAAAFTFCVMACLWAWSTSRHNESLTTLVERASTPAAPVADSEARRLWSADLSVQGPAQNQQLPRPQTPNPQAGKAPATTSELSMAMARVILTPLAGAAISNIPVESARSPLTGSQTVPGTGPASPLTGQAVASALTSHVRDTTLTSFRPVQELSLKQWQEVSENLAPLKDVVTETAGSVLSIFLAGSPPM